MLLHARNALQPRSTNEPQTMKILIEQCWEPTAAFRPTFEEILEFLQTIARDEVTLLDDSSVTCCAVLWYEMWFWENTPSSCRPSRGTRWFCSMMCL